MLGLLACIDCSQGFGKKLAATDTHVAILCPSDGVILICEVQSSISPQDRSGWEQTDCSDVDVPSASSIALETSLDGQQWLAVGTSSSVLLFR